MAEPTSWREAVRRYRIHAELRHAAGTREKAERVFARIDAFLRSRAVDSLEAITVELLEDYQFERHQTGVANASINGDLAHLSALLSWAMRHQLVGTNVCDRVEALPVPRRIPESADPAAVRTIAEDLLRSPVTRPYGELTVFVGNVGARIGEICWAHAEDIDLKHELIWFRSRPQYPIKRAIERMFPLNAAALEIARTRVAAAIRPSQFLFTTLRGGRIDQRTALHVLQRRAWHLGIGHINWQMIRRAMSTKLAMCDGMTEQKYQMMTGQSVAVAKRWYWDARRADLPKPPAGRTFRSRPSCSRCAYQLVGGDSNPLSPRSGS